MASSRSLTKRAIGGGFIVATAAALIAPGLANAAGSTDSLTKSVSADSLTGLLGDFTNDDGGIDTGSLSKISDSLSCFDNSGLGGTHEITGIDGLIGSINLVNVFLGDCA